MASRHGPALAQQAVASWDQHPQGFGAATLLAGEGHHQQSGEARFGERIGLDHHHALGPWGVRASCVVMKTWDSIRHTRAITKQAGLKAIPYCDQYQAPGSLHHKPQDLPHDLQHLIEPVVAKGAHGMGPGSAGLPIEGFDLVAKHKAVGLRPV